MNKNEVIAAVKKFADAEKEAEFRKETAERAIAQEKSAMALAESAKKELIEVLRDGGIAV